MVNDRFNGINLSADRGENLLNAEGKIYSIEYFNDTDKYPRRGGNGVVFKLVDADTNEYAIKICKISREEYNSGNRSIKKRYDRFYREIEALQRVADFSPENIIKFYSTDEIKIGTQHFPYYIMEKCDSHLGEYLEQERELTISQRVFLFAKIVEGTRLLHEVGIYHRDIKHTNILFLDGEPKISDLGLVNYKDSTIKITEVGEPIGPLGWLSPEATNKILAENKSNPFNFGCRIESKSDVFQLGKLFWYILQGNLPLGQVLKEDLVSCDNEKVFDLIFDMLQYSLKRRINIKTLDERINSLFPAFNL